MVEHIGDCDKCGKTNVRIEHRWTSRADKHCGKCNRDRLKAAQKSKPKRLRVPKEIVRYAPLKKPIPISKNPTPRLTAMRDEDWVVGLKIWLSRPRECVECGKHLVPDNNGIPYKIYFSHVLSKGAHPELRFDPMNIVLHCPRCHRNWETSGKMREMKTYALKLSYMEQNGFVPKN